MPTFGSLFAGVGGFDLGFEAAGWDCAWQVEWDAKCRSVLAHRWPDVERFGDVRDVGAVDVLLAQQSRSSLSGRSLRDDHGGFGDRDRDPARGVLRPVDCITYGFPCQDLSVAGKRAGLDGERSGLFFEATRIIREMREATDGTHPRVAVAENVPGLLSADGGAAMGRCLDELADLGALGIEWAVLDSQHFGVPQRRRRVFIVAWFDPRIGGADPLLPVASRCQGHHRQSGTAGTRAARTVAACLNSGGNDGGFRTEPGEHLIPTPLTTRSVPALHAEYLIPAVKVVRSGARDADGNLPPEVWREEQVAPTLNAFDNNSEARATVLAFTANQRDEVREIQVAGALAAEPGMKQQTFLSEQQGVRRLTPRECERLQGWPDDHTRWGVDGEMSDSFRYRACGNGVTAPVAEWIAHRIKENL